jgi:hypothetical protein
MSEPWVEGSQAGSWNYLKTHLLIGLVAGVGCQPGMSVDFLWAHWGSSHHGDWQISLKESQLLPFMTLPQKSLAPLLPCCITYSSLKRRGSHSVGGAPHTGHRFAGIYKLLQILISLSSQLSGVN